MKFRKFLFLILAVLAFATNLHAKLSSEEEIDPVLKLPLKWVRFVSLHRMYNIDFFHRQVSLEPLTEAVVPVYIWEAVPNEKRETWGIHISENFKSDPFVSNFVKEIDGKKRVHIIAPNVEELPIPELFNRFGKPTKTLKGIKLRSHSSYFVWDPENPKQDPFVFKAPQRDNEHDLVSPHSLHRGVLASDFLFRRLRDKKDSQFFGFFPEPIYIGLITEKFHYGFLVRFLKPVPHEGFDQEQNEIIPLHAFLGSTLLDESAAASQMSRSDYILNVYLPRLAHFARKLFDEGVFHASHTQNLTVVLNKQTKELLGFAFGDLSDLGVFGPAYSDEGKELHSLTHVMYESMDGAAPEAKAPGWFWAHYLGQSAALFEGDLKLQRTYALEFLEILRREIESSMNHPVRFSIPAQIALARLASSNENWHWQKTLRAMHEVFEDIYDATIDHEYPKVLNEWFQYPANLLTKIVDENKDSVLVSKDKAAVATFERKAFLTLAFDGKRILWVDQNTGRVSIVTAELNGEQKDRLRRAKVDFSRYRGRLHELKLDEGSIEKHIIPILKRNEVAISSLKASVTSGFELYKAFDGKYVIFYSIKTEEPMIILGPLNRAEISEIKKQIKREKSCAAFARALGRQEIPNL